MGPPCLIEHITRPSSVTIACADTSMGQPWRIGQPDELVNYYPAATQVWDTHGGSKSLFVVMVNQTSSFSITLCEHKYGSAIVDGTLLTCNSQLDELVNHYNERTHV